MQAKWFKYRQTWVATLPVHKARKIAEGSLVYVVGADGRRTVRRVCTFLPGASRGGRVAFSVVSAAGSGMHTPGAKGQALENALNT